MEGIWEWELKGSAYAVLKNSGELILFRSSNTYTNNMIYNVTDINGDSYTGTVFTGVETNNSFTSSTPWSTKRTSITSVRIANNQIIKPLSTASWFYGCSKVTSINLTGLDTSNTVSFYSMFKDCPLLVEVIGLSSFVTSNVTSFESLFHRCTALTSITGLSTWDTSNVTTMSNAFMNCRSLISIDDLSGWDTSKVCDTAYMFGGCYKLIETGDLSEWNTSSLRYTNKMFSYCLSLTNIDLSGWNTHALVSTIEMFSGDAKLQYIDIGKMTTTNCTSMTDMFKDVSKLSTIVLGSNFSFTGNGTTSCLLPTPTGNTYSGKWIKTTGGTAYTPEGLQSINGSDIKGTWIWELNGGAYAVLTDTNDSQGAGKLIFFRSNETYTNKATGTDFTDVAGNTYSGIVYSGIETLNGQQPWYENALQITSVSITPGQII